jgi:aminoglycoside phosphotransferase family enzyme
VVRNRASARRAASTRDDSRLSGQGEARDNDASIPATMNHLVTRSASLPQASDPGLAAKVRFLAEAQNYPEATGRVDIIETHMSWVFLTDRHAWKLKKPVRQSYLDFTTEAARRRNCVEELRLNRRLTKDVYLEVVPLTVDTDGRLRLGTDGAAVDWLVKMRRLPADRMLDRLIRAGSARAEDVRRIVDALCRFRRMRACRHRGARMGSASLRASATASRAWRQLRADRADRR